MRGVRADGRDELIDVLDHSISCQVRGHGRECLVELLVHDEFVLVCFPGRRSKLG